MKALVVVIMGGVGNMAGSLLAGMLLGVAEALCSYYVDFGPDACGRLRAVSGRAGGPAARPVRDALTWPTRPRTSAGAAIAPRRDPRWSRWSPRLAAVPWLISDYGLSLMVNVMGYVVLTIAWALFSGTTRLVSLATSAFFGVGMYTVAVLVKACAALRHIRVAARSARRVAL